jgi:hypothetical protein
MYNEGARRDGETSIDGFAPSKIRNFAKKLTFVPAGCGYWGGPTGLGFALSNSDRARALVIMSTWAWPPPPAEFPQTDISLFCLPSDFPA